MVTGEQIRAARGLLGISGRALAEASGISYPTIQRLEAHGTGKSGVATIVAIQDALENQGIQFLDTGDVSGGKGVSLK